MSGQSTEDVEGRETILYESMMADTCHYTFVNTCGMYNTKSELQRKLQIWGGKKSKQSQGGGSSYEENRKKMLVMIVS